MSPFLLWEADSTQSGESDPTAAIPHHGRGVTQALSFARCRARHGTQARESLSRQEPQGHTADAEFVGLEMGLGSKRERVSVLLTVSGPLGSKLPEVISFQ